MWSDIVKVSPASVFGVLAGLHLYVPERLAGLCSVGNLDVVDDANRASSFGHTCGRALVLRYAGSAFPCDHPAVDLRDEAVLSDLGLGQLRPDLLLDFGVAESRGDG